MSRPCLRTSCARVTLKFFQDDHETERATPANPTAPAGTVANPNPPAGGGIIIEPVQCIAPSSGGRRPLAAASARFEYPCAELPARQRFCSWRLTGARSL